MKKYNDCMEVREEFSAYLDGEMSAEEREPLEAHLAICAECLREMDVLKRVDDSYRALAPVGAPADFEQGVRDAVRAGQMPSASGRGPVPRWMGPLVAMASAAAVLIVGVLVLEWQDSNRPAMQMASAPMEMDLSQAGSALMKSKEAEPVVEADSAVAGREEKDWDSFAQTPARDNSAWEQFTQSAPRAAAPVGGGREDSAQLLAQDLATEGALEASAPKAALGALADSADAEVRARAEVIGTPPPAEADLSSIEKLFDAPAADKAEAVQESAPQSSAPAQAGDVVSRQTLRSFRVLAGGLWVEEGYDHEPTTPLKRSSPELRELMKKFPESDWTKLLERPYRQVFQMGDAWYDLEASPEE